MLSNKLPNEVIKTAKTEELELALDALRALVDATEIELANHIAIKNELEARLGQPMGELHLTVVKGSKGQSENFSLEAKK